MKQRYFLLQEGKFLDKLNVFLFLGSGGKLSFASRLLGFSTLWSGFVARSPLSWPAK